MLSRRTIRDLVIETFQSHRLPGEICTDEIADIDGLFAVLRTENITLTDEQWEMLHSGMMNGAICYFFRENPQMRKYTEDCISVCNYPDKVEKYLLTNSRSNGICIDGVTESFASKHKEYDEHDVKWHTLFIMFFMRYLSEHASYDFDADPNTNAGLKALQDSWKLEEEARSWAIVEVLCCGDI